MSTFRNHHGTIDGLRVFPREAGKPENPALVETSPLPRQTMTTLSTDTNLETEALARTSPSWRRLVVATLAAAVGDAAFAFVAYVLVSGRYNFETLLQYIASGLAGQSAFTTGWSGVGYAAFGFAIHVALSAGFVVVFAVTIAPRLTDSRAAAVSGLAYGVVVWLFMNAVVLPLGRSAHESFFDGYYIAFLIDHALLVGLPIALILTLGLRRTETR